MSYLLILVHCTFSEMAYTVVIVLFIFCILETLDYVDFFKYFYQQYGSIV